MFQILLPKTGLERNNSLKAKSSSDTSTAIYDAYDGEGSSLRGPICNQVLCVLYGLIYCMEGGWLVLVVADLSRFQVHGCCLLSKDALQDPLQLQRILHIIAQIRGRML